MSDDSQSEVETGSDEDSTAANLRKTRRTHSGVRLWRLASKELRETLRDRRTIVTLILMPLLVYPILSLLFQNFLLTNAKQLGKSGEPIAFSIVFQSNKSDKETFLNLQEIEGRRLKLEQLKSDRSPEPGNGAEDKGESSDIEAQEALGAENEFVDFLEHRWLQSPTEDDRGIRDAVQEGQASVGVRFTFPENQDGWKLGDVEIFESKSYDSQVAATYLRDYFERLNESITQELLVRTGLPVEPRYEVLSAETVSTNEEGGGNQLAGLIPLVLVLMTITGAVYPAIDLTAGERERGTLETLMAAPIPRMGILLAKFIAVLTVAVFTAVLNVVGMATVIWVFQLEDLLLGDGGFTFVVMFKVFLLMILFAAFFSAVLLAVTSFARSFKEAQAYLIPIILLSMGPGLLAMNPSLKLAGAMSVTPMVNILLLARDVIQGQNEFTPTVIAIVSTVLYALFAIFVAARTFGDDKILYAQSGSFREMFVRPRETHSIVPLMSAMFCLVLLFPVNLIAIGFLGRVAKALEGNFVVVCGLMACFTVISFFVLPSLIAKFQRVRFSTGFGFKGTSIVYFLSAILLGVSLWPIVMSIVEGWYSVYGMIAGEEAAKGRHEQLVELSGQQVSKFREVSPIVIALCFSIVPSFCEEWFFRGMLLRSMLKHWTVGKSILVSALMFGLFHVLSNSAISLDRFIPTMLVGLLLGYLCYKSDSILPGVILHSLHNGIVAFLGYYQPQLSKFEWFPGEADPMPMMWTVVAVGIALLATGLIAISRKRSPQVLIDDPAVA